MHVIAGRYRELKGYFLVDCHFPIHAFRTIEKWAETRESVSWGNVALKEHTIFGRKISNPLEELDAIPLAPKLFFVVEKQNT